MMIMRILRRSQLPLCIHKHYGCTFSTKAASQSAADVIANEIDTHTSAANITSSANINSSANIDSLLNPIDASVSKAGLTPGEAAISVRLRCVMQNRLIDFDASYLQNVPFWLKWMEPVFNSIRDVIVQFNEYIGLPWWMLLMLCSFTVRATIIPLIFVQMKRISKMAPAAPVFVFIKDTWKQSNIPLFPRLKLLYALYRRISQAEGFRLLTMWVYNIAYYPMLISMIFSIRKVIATPQLKQATFLHIQNFADLDPYYILPTLTIVLYYYNFERYITKENEHTIASRIRRICQVLLFIWYPYLSHWPAGLTLYMFSNALFSVLQGSVMKTMWFMAKMHPVTMEYNRVLFTAEYDNKMAESITQAIKRGDEDYKKFSIKEEVLFAETLQSIKNLNRHEQIEQKKAAAVRSQFNSKWQSYLKPSK